MRSPFLAARIEQRGDPSGSRIDAGDVRSFECVAMEAGKSEVIRGRRPAVLAGNDVVDLERVVIAILGKAAIFAAPPGALPNQLNAGWIHGRVMALTAVRV
jgi:hypothetical protein